MYLTYDKYKSMGGTLDEAAFNDYEFESETIINWYTFNRLKTEKEENYPPELQRCMYHLIRLLKDLADASANVLDGGVTSTGAEATIASQSNDGVSVSYNVISASQKVEQADKQKAKIVQMYLNGCVDSLGRKLLYRGLYPGE